MTPTFTDILEAKQTIARYLPRPLSHYPALNKLCGAQILVEHENHQPTGAFKVRGGINLISQLSRRRRIEMPQKRLTPADNLKLFVRTRKTQRKGAELTPLCEFRLK